MVRVHVCVCCVCVYVFVCVCACFSSLSCVIILCVQHDRARVVYKYALDHLPKELCQEVYKQYTIHEKKFGSRAAIEDVIVSKRRFHYEEVRRGLVFIQEWECFQLMNILLVWLVFFLGGGLVCFVQGCLFV